MPSVDPAVIAWFLPLTLPVAIWVAWSDMKFMKIPNKAVLALMIGYLVLGPVLLPLTTWAWGWALFVIVLIIGFLINAIGMVGAGDAKYAAAMAPFFIGSDIRLVMALFAACLLGAFFSHRMVKRIPVFRNATADWESWTRSDFPMGLALSGTLVFYPLLGLWLSSASLP